MVLLAQIVFVEESCAIRCNSDEKASAISFLNLYLAHCSIPRMSFQLGRRPGISIEKIGTS